MKIPAPDVPAIATLPLYDHPESPPANRYSVERLPIHSRKFVWKQPVNILQKVENLAVIGDLPCFFAWPCYSGNHPAKFN